jgi:hypothetical protein
MTRINLVTNKRQNRLYRQLRGGYRIYERRCYAIGVQMWAWIIRWQAWRFGRAVVGDRGKRYPIEARFYGPLVRVRRVRV